MTEFEDEYSAAIEGDIQEIKGALFNATVKLLGPTDPICLTGTATVDEAVRRMLERRQSAVLVVDGDRRVVGIFTERDVLLRVLGKAVDARTTALATVMTPNPEVLTLDDRVAYAIHSMSVAGYRTVPVVDQESRAIGIVTASDVIRWLASLFPEAVLNLRPGDRLKNPHEVDAG